MVSRTRSNELTIHHMIASNNDKKLSGHPEP